LFVGRGIGFDLAAGILLSSLFVFGIGLAGLLYPGIVGVALAACLPGGLAYAREAWRAADGIPLRRAWPALFLLPALPWIIAAPLCPPTDVDILTYHAGLPELWALHHRIFAFPGNVFFNLPLGLERMPFYFMPFGISRAAAGFHLILLAVGAVLFAQALTVGGFRPGSNTGPGVAGGWLFFGSGAALALAGSGHPDTALLLAAALGTLAIVRGSAVGLGVACALAVSGKYTGGALAAAMLVSATWRGKGARFTVRGPAIAAVICLALNLPWMLRNLYETGNPLYPFAAGIFPSLNWSRWNAVALWAVMRDASVAVDRYFPEDLAVQLPTVVWRGVKTIWVSPYASLLIVMPVVLLGRVFSPPARRLALASALFALVWLVPEPKVGRYLLPGLVPALGAFLFGCFPFQSRLSPVLYAFVLLGGLSFAAQAGTGPERVLTGALGAREYARARIGSYEDARDWVNARPGANKVRKASGASIVSEADAAGHAGPALPLATPGDGRILVVGQADGHGLSRAWVSNDDTARPAWLLVTGEDARDPDRVRIRFRQADVRLVLYNPIRAIHRRALSRGLNLPDAWYSGWAGFWRRHARLVRDPGAFDWTGGWYVYEIGRAGSSPAERPWLPGAEALLSEDAELIRGHPDAAVAARRDRLIGDFGISWYQRMLAILGDGGSTDAAIRAGKEAAARGLATPWLFDTLAKACRARGLAKDALAYERRAKILADAGASIACAGLPAPGASKARHAQRCVAPGAGAAGVRRAPLAAGAEQ
jgi:hypothetical protein